MSRVAVNEDVLRWAIERAGLTPERLHQPKFPIQEWLSGATQPTVAQLQKLAKKTLTPFGYLFLSKPPVERLPIEHFRTIADSTPARPSPELLATVWAMQRRQSWMRDYLMDKGEAPLPFVASARVGDRVEAVAGRMRAALGLADGWAARQRTWEDALRVLREAMDATGVLVVVNGILGNNTHRGLDVKEFRGFVLVDEYAPLAFVNGSDSKAAQMFTLGHELAHVFFGSSAAFDLRDMQPANNETERACNQVAAEFLVPADELREGWIPDQDIGSALQTMARHFKVSEIVVALRALHLALLGREAFDRFYADYEARVKQATAPVIRGGDYYRNQNLRIGRRFGSAVVDAVANNELLYSEAFELTGLSGKTFTRYAGTL